MIYDTNLLIGHIRKRTLPPVTTLIPIIVVAELEAFALKGDWGFQKVEFMRYLVERYPILDIEIAMINRYAEIDAFSQGRLQAVPLLASARNMGKNDLWRSAVAIAIIALYLDTELHTTDNDFDHLPALGLQLVKH